MPRRALVVVPWIVAACFDWNVASPDGGSDATVDSSDDVGPDARDDETASDAPAEAIPPDAVSDPCPALAAAVASARAAAQACGSGSCYDPGFADECGCIVGVADLSSQLTTDYKNAIGAFADAGCACNAIVCSADGGTPLKCIASGDAGSCVP